MKTKNIMYAIAVYVGVTALIYGTKVPITPVPRGKGSGM